MIRPLTAPGLGLALLLALAGPLLAPPATTPAMAQAGLNLGGGGGLPLQVDAEDGIEWHEARRVYIARGNAVATRGTVTVRADTLTAHYRDRTDASGTEVWRLDAEGNVVITSPNESAYGDAAAYSIDHGVMVMTGRALRFVSPDQEITARDSLEYWVERRLAVARGDAKAVRTDQILAADVLTATFTENGAGGETGNTGAGAGEDSEGVDVMEAFGNVVISTPREIVRAEYAQYVAATEIATLRGDVRITRGDNQLNGDNAEVNLRTGVSRLLAGPGGGRVQGRFEPGSEDGMPGRGGQQ